MMVAKLWNKKAGRYTGRCMRPKGREKIYTNFKSLEIQLKANNSFFGDTNDLEVHVFTLNRVKTLNAETFWAVGDL